MPASVPNKLTMSQELRSALDSAYQGLTAHSEYLGSGSVEKITRSPGTRKIACRSGKLQI